MRATTGAIEQSVPSWVLFSLPFALWVLAYMLIVDAVWINSFSALRHAWFWCMPVIAIAAELAQIKNMIPGYFDLADLIAIMIAASIALFVTSIQKTIKEDYHE